MLQHTAFAAVLGTLLALAAAPAVAQMQMPATGGAKEGAMPMHEAAPMAEGEIRKVDKDAGKLTIKHGPIARLDMPAMTMVYRVKDPAMLDQVRPGDKVRFEIEQIGGLYTVTRIEAAK